MEPIKVLNLDFGRVCEEKKSADSGCCGAKKVVLQERKEWDWIMKSTRIYIPGNDTKEMERKGGKIFTAPILIVCQSPRDKFRV
jgi:hypothetical protein